MATTRLGKVQIKKYLPENSPFAPVRKWYNPIDQKERNDTSILTDAPFFENGVMTVATSYGGIIDTVEKVLSLQI